MTDAQEPTICSLHNRQSYLWGGDVCDVCDKDGNGTADMLEPVGVGPNAHNPSLFAPKEKGWRVTQGACMGRIPHHDPRQGQINAWIQTLKSPARN